MTDVQIDTAELPPNPTRATPRAALRAFALSIFINGVCPWLLYTRLAPYFPHGSVKPLLYASVFPVFGLLFGIARKRRVDFIAAIALFEIVLNIIEIYVTPTIRMALVARSLNSFLTASTLLVSALIRRPVVYYVVRQFVTANDPARLQPFEARNLEDGGKTFLIATYAWACAVYVLSAVNAVMALSLEPATYLLLHPFVGQGVNLLMIGWTVFFVSRRFIPRTA